MKKFVVTGGAGFIGTNLEIKTDTNPKHSYHYASGLLNEINHKYLDCRFAVLFLGTYQKLFRHERKNTGFRKIFGSIPKILLRKR